jgi:hypothetical protein
MVGSHSRGVQFGRILRADVSVRSLNLSSVILVEMSALPGDSGAPLVDASNRLLGLLVGGNGTQQLFCSIAPILSALQCELF